MILSSEAVESTGAADAVDTEVAEAAVTLDCATEADMVYLYKIRHFDYFVVVVVQQLRQLPIIIFKRVWTILLQKDFPNFRASSDQKGLLLI